jgi:hypothetical protein
MQFLANENFPLDVVEAIDSRTDWTANFSVVEPGRIRMRPMPSRPGP